MSKRMLVLICSIFLIVPLAFMGCSGSDGANGAAGAAGAAGADGADGATGATGPVTNTNESCMVCHTTGRTADVAVVHPADAAQAVIITVDNVVNAADKAQVSVHLEDASGEPITADLFEARRLAFYLADLVPAGTVTNATLGTKSSDYFKRWANEDFRTVGSILDNTDNANGNYVFTFNTGFSTLGTAGVDYADYSYTSDTHVQRLIVTFRPWDGTLYNRASATFDFLIPAVGATAVELDTQRMFVTPAVCKKCHGPNMAGAAHGSSYVNTTACVVCHSPFYNDEMNTQGVQLSEFIHKIHSALPVEPFPTRINGNGYVDVTYPQDVRVCVTCHNNASGEAVGTGNEVDNWKAHPTAAICGSCHVTAFDPTTPTHTGGIQPDASCSFCHPATGHVAVTLGASVTEAHDTSATAVLHPTPMNVPEFDVTQTLSAPANGTHYVAGDNVTVTVTLAFHGGAAVPSSVYTTLRGANGVTDNILRSASLYVYGPRAMPKPILAAQSTSMFAGGTDTNVLTDATGFKYRVTIPAGLANGTYMVRTRFGDFGYVSTSSYKLESIGFQTIQIGSATPTNKVAGDSCTDCHGVGVTAPFHDARHVVAWDTDECVSCHDYSGGHAATLSNRVHAVHSENSWGDMNNTYGTTTSRTWDEVTYPQNIDRCVTCHSSNNTSYLSTVGEVSCLGCHGDDPNPSTFVGGATNHMLQSGGHYPAMP